MKGICVFASSSNAVDQEYKMVAEQLGREMAKNGYDLVYGAGSTGLMGAVSAGIHQEKGKVIGIVPHLLNDPSIIYQQCDQLIVTDDMRKRKTVMEEQSDGFITLPGGFGTLEELLEILTLKQLKVHNKPIVIVNTNGFYNGLIQVFEQIMEEKFAKVACREFYYVAETVDEAVDYINNYQEKHWEEQWFTDVEER